MKNRGGYFKPPRELESAFYVGSESIARYDPTSKHMFADFYLITGEEEREDITSVCVVLGGSNFSAHEKIFHLPRCQWKYKRELSAEGQMCHLAIIHALWHLSFGFSKGQQ